MIHFWRVVLCGTEYLTVKWHQLVHFIDFFHPRLATLSLPQKIAFAPYNAVYWLTRRTPNCAHWIAFRSFFRCAVVASRNTLFNDLNLPIKPCRTAFDQRHICSQTHLVHMPSGFQVVESIENQSKCLEPLGIELGVFDVCVMRLQLHHRIELMRRILCHLYFSHQSLFMCSLVRVPTRALDFLMCSCRKRN
jgi:hypothetical protein